MLVKNIKDRLVRWEEFFEVKLNHYSPSAVVGIVGYPLGHTLNCGSPAEEEI